MDNCKNKKMGLSIVKGNIFNTKCQTVVNTVNCVGVMGKGIALVYKLRYPRMYDLYKEHCKKGLIKPGKLWLYKGENLHSPWVLNFPTKNHWKFPSKIQYIESGLQKFVETYEAQGITSVAFPLLGADNGGLDGDVVIGIMTKYLADCNIPIEIYEYDSQTSDDLYETFRYKWGALSLESIKSETKLRTDKIKLVEESLKDPQIKSMMDLIRVPKLGLKTLEKCFRFVMTNNSNNTLF